jgi:hypothetical protein
VAYKYRGSNHDVPSGTSLITIPRHGRKPLAFNTDKCGTKAGYRQHQRRGIPMCNQCRNAQAEYMRGYNAVRRAA